MVTTGTPAALSKGIIRVGHRGAAGHAPENTLAAIRKGIALGVDFVEVDVQRSRDGRLVVMHDPSVDRTTNGRGLVAEMPWEELRLLDAGDGERVPSLEEVLAETKGRAGVMLEAKASGTGTAIHDVVQSSGFAGPVVYASFLHAEILAIRRIDPAARTLALIEWPRVRGVAFARKAEATLVGMSIDFGTMRFVTKLHDAGLEAWCYTANEPRQIDRALRLGVDGIISDYPERVPKMRP